MPVRLGVTSDRLSVTLEGVSAKKQVGWAVGWVEQTNGWKVSLGSVAGGFLFLNKMWSVLHQPTQLLRAPVLLSSVYIYLGLESLIDQIPTI